MTSWILAATGDHLAAGGLRIVRQAAATGATVLALDSSAADVLSRQPIAWTVYDDWLDETARREMHRTRDVCATGWYASARDAFTIDGVCWPELDHVMMSGFWEEHALQLSLAESFVNRGVKRLSFFRTTGSRPSFHRSPSDTFGRTWEALLRGSLRVDVLTSGVQPPSAWSVLRRRAAGRIARSAAAVRAGTVRVPQEDALRGRIVVAIGEDETARFHAHVAELTRDRPDGVAVVVLEPDTATALRRGSAWRLPVLPGPRPSGDVPSARLLEGLDQARRSSAGQPWESALRGSPFHFDAYARTRWPAQASALRRWQELWQRLEPTAVIVSSLDDARSQLPAIAARHVGVPSVAMPHAAFYVKSRAAVESDWLLYSSSLQRRAFSSVVSETFKLAPYLPPGSTPSTVARARASEAGRLSVLALTNPVTEDHPGRAIHDVCVGHREQLDALAVLFGDPPPDFPYDVDVRLKPHPLYRDLPLLRAAGADVAAAVLPIDADLADELQRTDVVVGVNYVGSAVSAVSAAGRPLVHLWTAPLLRRASPNPYAAALADQGLMAVDGPTFWHALLAASQAPRLAVPDRTTFAHDPEDAAEAGSLSEFVRRRTGRSARS